MANAYISIENLFFLLTEVHNIQSLQKLDRYQDYDLESIFLALNAAKSVSDQYLYPILTEMDHKKAYAHDGKVLVHPRLKDAITALAEGGWIGATQNYESGGSQMPHMLANAASLIFYAANANAAAYAFLTNGSSNLIQSFGSEEMKKNYIEKMYNGKWQGTMALTEPEAGSSLSDLSTTAVATDKEGVYKIKGQKIFISAGDHNATDNVIHLTLARIEGAPVGTKGISLFVVPKYRLNETSTLESNDVLTAGVYGKMGQKGYVAAHLMMGENDNTLGYIVGTPHQGLKYMFQMMNEARIGTGLIATGISSAAYYTSLQYAKERSQGRDPDTKDPNSPPLHIIKHADVRRMLLYQKAIVEGSASLLILCSKYDDLAQAASDEVAKEAHTLLELLTPVAKSFPAEIGNLSVSQAMQVLGGAGYTDDFPVEQYYRDIRINAIYEGTTTIHGMDLLGRKIAKNNGEALKNLEQQIQKTILAAQKHEQLNSHITSLSNAMSQLNYTTLHLFKLAKTHGSKAFLSKATIYLQSFSLIVIAWQWLEMGVKSLEQHQTNGKQSSTFYQSKLATMEYFFYYHLPETQALFKILQNPSLLTSTLDDDLLI